MIVEMIPMYKEVPRNEFKKRRKKGYDKECKIIKYG